MDPYHYPNLCLGRHLSYGHGAWGRPPPPPPMQENADTDAYSAQMVRSRWHVPVQTIGTALAILGYFLGHHHGGRQFASNIHSSFAGSLQFMLAAQVVIGIYLKLHLERGFLGRIRRWIVPAHGVLGKALPVVSWVQMLFGGITAMGYCREDHLGQCLAHFIMGSAFIAYGIILTILLLVGQVWLRRTGRSQEFFDSLIIALWGCVNTFTEHRWGQDWRGNDLQHTSMGIVWWCAGLLGMWMSRKRNGRPKRNLIPAIVIILTGWAMGGHPQSLELSTHVHAIFGYTLMAAGAARIVEISFVLRDRHSLSSHNTEETNSFQYLTPYVSDVQRTPVPPPLTFSTAPLCLRLLVHGRYRRTARNAVWAERHACVLHPATLLGGVSLVPLR